MSGVTVNTEQVTVTVADDGETVVVTTGQIAQTTFDALEARVAALEANVTNLDDLNILLLEG
jgi:cell division protein FtsB